MQTKYEIGTPETIFITVSVSVYIFLNLSFSKNIYILDISVWFKPITRFLWFNFTIQERGANEDSRETFSFGCKWRNQ